MHVEHLIIMIKDWGAVVTLSAQSSCAFCIHRVNVETKDSHIVFHYEEIPLNIPLCIFTN